MTNKKKPVETVEQALMRAHRHRPEILPDAAWSREVMRQVRKEAGRASAELPCDTGLHLIWRFATAACSVAALGLLLTLAMDSGTELLALHLAFDPLFSPSWSLLVPALGGVL